MTSAEQHVTHDLSTSPIIDPLINLAVSNDEDKRNQNNNTFISEHPEDSSSFQVQPPPLFQDVGYKYSSNLNAPAGLRQPPMFLAF